MLDLILLYCIFGAFGAGLFVGYLIRERPRPTTADLIVVIFLTVLGWPVALYLELSWYIRVWSRK